MVVNPSKVVIVHPKQVRDWSNTTSYTLNSLLRVSPSALLLGRNTA